MFGDGDAFSGFEEACDVVLCSVVRDSAHGCAAAFGEGDVHDWGGIFGVLKEHFIEIAKAVEEDDVCGEAFPHGEVLRHHWRGSGHGAMVGGVAWNFKFLNDGEGGGGWAIECCGNV